MILAIFFGSQSVILRSCIVADDSSYFLFEDGKSIDHHPSKPSRIPIPFLYLTSLTSEMR
jgi:hypothetical protein